MATTTVSGSLQQTGEWNGTTWTSGAATVSISESAGRVMGLRFGGWTSDFLLSGSALTFTLTNVGAAQVPLTFSVYARMSANPDFYGAANPPPLISEMSLLSDALVVQATVDDTGAQTLNLTPSLMVLNTVRYVAGETFSGFALNIHARTADGSVLTVGGQSSSPTMSLTLDTRTFTGIQIPWGVLASSVPDHCPICGDITLRENWLWCAFHKRLECPNCADPEDRPVLITSGRWIPVGGYGTSTAAVADSDVAITVLDTDTIDLTLASNVLSAAIIAGAITNSHIAAAAEIARSKLATSSNGNRLVVNNSAGVMTDAAAITPNRLLASNSDGIPTHLAVTETEAGYLSGVTSNLQTQLGTKITAGAGAIVNADINALAAVALSKLAALTASRLVVSDASGVLSASSVTSTEAGYLSGVTSAIQTQLGTKITSGAGAIVNADVNAAAAVALSKLAAMTASRLPVTDASGFLTASSVTSTEAGYLSGVTSAIQTQLGTKITSGTGAIVNADVNAAAAIAVSKLAAMTGSRVVTTTAGGALTTSSVTDTELSYMVGVTSAIQTQFNTINSTNGSKLLATYSPAVAASVDITSIISSTYEHYEIRFWLRPATDDVELWIRTDSNNGASFDAGASDYAFITNITTTAATSAAFADDANDEMSIGQNSANVSIGNAAGEGVSGVLTFHTGNSSANPRFDARCWYIPASGNSRHIRFGGERLSAAAINAVQLLFESGNITDGEVQIYGLTQS